MPRSRPDLKIDLPRNSMTLPANFTFNYVDSGEPPKTPERELAVPNPPSPTAYRIKRRFRPKVTTSDPRDQLDQHHDAEDVPLPTIEAPEMTEPVRPLMQLRATEPADGYLAPASFHDYMTAPRTPTAQFDLFHNGWNNDDQSILGESITRPMSTCSLSSDSSDSSNVSSTSRVSQGGSCTSPESDAPNPFPLTSVKQATAKEEQTAASADRVVVQKEVSKKKRVYWSPEMDTHLWATYLLYVRDPTMTPFKAVPGSTPPLGVCRRVSREAKRTWRMSRVAVSKPTETPATPSAQGAGEEADSKIKLTDSPDTIKPDRSGSSTPTVPIILKVHAWPRSAAATRRRLRELSRRKYSIAPYYQRLLGTRSSSPFASSPQSAFRSSRLPSPYRVRKRIAFGTRDIQISLATSTAASMQPNGPLAQLVRASFNEASSDESFNDPIEPSVPSSTAAFDHGLGINGLDVEPELPRLGSPFAYHTWGPSRSRQHLRPTAPRTQSDISSSEPMLMSPVRLHHTMPHPSALKRRALYQLDEEASPGDAGISTNFLAHLFASPAESSHRRVRTRGFSLGDAHNHHTNSSDNNNVTSLTSLFTPPATYDQMTSPELAEEGAVVDTSNFVPPPLTDSMKRLGSPFAGIARRPARKGASRHAASASLSAVDRSNFTSIDQMLGQLPTDDAFAEPRPN
ncbi:MAG: hypothetical protein LQ347_006252 [Umbilicaria vellea]|nr:MAG: hypothetical protein LQ347_006252 [Umbilicaria vellea]